jgi:hypothetical protein
LFWVEDESTGTIANGFGLQDDEQACPKFKNGLAFAGLCKNGFFGMTTKGES